MQNYKTIIVALVAGICAIICVSIASTAITDIKLNKSGNLLVTGSATKDFKSDTIFWQGGFSKKANTTQDAYSNLKADEKIIKTYLANNGVKDTDISFSSIDISQNSRFEETHNPDTGQTTTKEYPDGYTLTQYVSINSSEVDKVSDISRDITQLIEQGVGIRSNAPEYYYSKLDELKIEMIAEATQNAKTRAEVIMENSNSQAEKLVDANLGVFQITGYNSSTDEYSSTGVFNTSSMQKTVQITVKLNYLLK